MDGQKLKTTIESDDSVSLIREKIKQEDVGKYSCEITNSQGSASTSCNVTVTGNYNIHCK